jgi:DDE superfamily endonuclease
LTGRRHVQAGENRTRRDWALFIRAMLVERYPAAVKIRLVLDNLNTHTTASLYETFPAPEARRLAERIEFHYTPKHGSWLNVAEIELSALARQCLDRRIPSLDLLNQEINAWQVHRNNRPNSIDWQFTTTEARIKLKRLYPNL